MNMSRARSFMHSSKSTSDLSILKRDCPTTAEGYELLEECGRGVSATVYRARVKNTEDIVAVKLLDLDSNVNCSLEDIIREAQTMRQQNHPNVLPLYCSFVHQQHLWMVMPYVGGGSVLNIMKYQYPDGLEEPVIATILKEVLKGLDYMHKHGNIHRDVKAGNILVDTNGQVLLADFGVAATMERGGSWGGRGQNRSTFVGTPCWMAPEVMEQTSGYNNLADIWSFGITILELAHGHAPFAKLPPMKVLLMTIQNPPPSLESTTPTDTKKHFSKAMRDIVQKCLVKDPTLRPTAAQLLEHKFFKTAHDPGYLVKHLLQGLPEVVDRIKMMRAGQGQSAQDERAQAMIEKSQEEYVRGMSQFKFDVEEYKRQLERDDAAISHLPTISETASTSGTEVQQPQQPYSNGMAAAGPVASSSAPSLPAASLSPSSTAPASTASQQQPSHRPTAMIQQSSAPPQVASTSSFHLNAPPGISALVQNQPGPSPHSAAPGPGGLLQLASSGALTGSSGVIGSGNLSSALSAVAAGVASQQGGVAAGGHVLMPPKPPALAIHSRVPSSDRLNAATTPSKERASKAPPKPGAKKQGRFEVYEGELPPPMSPVISNGAALMDANMRQPVTPDHAARVPMLAVETELGPGRSTSSATELHMPDSARSQGESAAAGPAGGEKVEKAKRKGRFQIVEDEIADARGARGNVGRSASVSNMEGGSGGNKSGVTSPTPQPAVVLLPPLKELLDKAAGQYELMKELVAAVQDTERGKQAALHTLLAEVSERQAQRLSPQEQAALRTEAAHLREENFKLKERIRLLEEELHVREVRDGREPRETI